MYKEFLTIYPPDIQYPWFLQEVEWRGGSNLFPRHSFARFNNNVKNNVLCADIYNDFFMNNDESKGLLLY